MSRPVGGPGAGPSLTQASTRSTEARENYGQLRSQVAHALNDLRKAQRTGDEAGLIDATRELASALNVNLGDTANRTGAQLLSALGEKLGLDPQNLNADSLRQLQQTATDRNRLSGLISDI